jgi:hypothetical protein
MIYKLTSAVRSMFLNYILLSAISSKRQSNVLAGSE